MIKYFIIFTAFGIFGAVIDTLYRFIKSKKYTSGTRFGFFSPIYAIGATILAIEFKFIEINPIFQIFIAGVSLTFLELLSGIFCVRIMKKRYWNYSKNKWNYKGHIDALHSFYWILLALLFRIIFPSILD